MAQALKHAWWTLLLRGTLAVIFALLLLFAPDITLATGAFSFTILFGMYALVDGLSTIMSNLMRRQGQWGLLLLLGIIAIIVGLVALGNPLIFSLLTITLMVYIMAFKAIAGGIVEIFSAWQLRQEIDNEWMMALSGLFALVFGLILLRYPIMGVEVLVLLAAFYLVITGVLQIILAFNVHGWSGKVDALNANISGAKR